VVVALQHAAVELLVQVLARNHRDAAAIGSLVVGALTLSSWHEPTRRIDNRCAPTGRPPT
jgi:hypothetical protein